MHLKNVGLARCEILETIPFCFLKNSFSAMRKHLNIVRGRCVENSDVTPVRNTPAVSLFTFPSATSFHPVSHMDILRVATEAELDRATLFSATRESFVWAKVLLVFCGKDFWSPEQPQNTEGIPHNPYFTSAALRLFLWSLPSFHHLS